MTIVWNEETSKEPVEDTVCSMEGHIISASQIKSLTFCNEKLIPCYMAFDARYKTLLGEYIHPDAEWNDLINRTITTAQRLNPLRCSSDWNADLVTLQILKSIGYDFPAIPTRPLVSILQ